MDLQRQWALEMAVQTDLNLAKVGASESSEKSSLARSSNWKAICKRPKLAQQLLLKFLGIRLVCKVLLHLRRLVLLWLNLQGQKPR